MKKIIIGIIGVLALISLLEKKEESLIIPEEAIRFRVIASSDSTEDQSIKNFVRDRIQKQMYEDLEDTKTSEEADLTIQKNISNYDQLVQDSLNKQALDLEYTMNYGKNYFPEKIYKGVTYPAGNYQSLVVTLGNGQGKNWWCVLFPPLCLLEAEETEETTEVEYKFFIQELLEKYF